MALRRSDGGWRNKISRGWKSARGWGFAHLVKYISSRSNGYVVCRTGQATDARSSANDALGRRHNPDLHRRGRCPASAGSAAETIWQVWANVAPNEDPAHKIPPSTKDGPKGQRGF